MADKRMFTFISCNHKRSGDTWNPLAGYCLHACSYCWAKALQKTYPTLKEKYSGIPRIIEKEMALAKKFTKDDFIFACDMTDLFGHWVPSDLIQQILDVIESSPATFLLLTKNPARYHDFKIPKNCVCGATIESDMIPKEISKAPDCIDRLTALHKLDHPRKMISIEPIMEFTPLFSFYIRRIKPEFVAIGYDNWDSHLPEPPQIEVEKMIPLLRDKGIIVYRKKMRTPELVRE